MTETPSTQRISLAALADIIGAALDGDGDVEITGLASLAEAGPQDVSFLANDRYVSQMAETQAAAVIVAENYAGAGPSLLRCTDPYLAYRQAMVHFYGFREHPFQGVSKQASVDDGARLAEDVSVGPFATICAGAAIGKGSVIYSGAFIGPNCQLGEDCLIYANVSLYENTILGDRVTVHASSSIGVDGYGFATAADETGVVVHQKIPPVGWVELEDDVEIGSNCAIQRATMGPTVIGAGTKFADLIAIGHGTKLGKHCLMVSQAGIAGSTVVGNYCVFGGQAGVVGHIRIGDGVRVGAQAGVTNDLPAGLEVLGSPAMPRGEAKRAALSVFKLPSLLKTVKTLSKDVQKLKEKLGDNP